MQAGCMGCRCHKQSLSQDVSTRGLERHDQNHSHILFQCLSLVTSICWVLTVVVGLQVALAAQVYDYVDQRIRRLDKDMKAFDAEMARERAKLGLPVRMLWLYVCVCVCVLSAWTCVCLFMRVHMHYFCAW